MPCFTSVQRLNAWAGRAEAAALDPVTGAELPGTGPGPGRHGQAHGTGRPVLAAGGRRAAGAARRAARHRPGPAAAVGRRPGDQPRQLPRPAALPRVRALPGQADRRPPSSRCAGAATRPAAWPWSSSSPAPGPGSSIGHPPAEPIGAARRDTDRAARAAFARQASRAWLSVPGQGEGLLISVLLDDPSSEQARAAVADAIEDATAAVALRVPFPRRPHLSRRGPSRTAIDAWIADNTRPFYHRDRSALAGTRTAVRDAVKAEVPGLLDVAAEQERSGEFHHDEPVRPGHDHARRRQRAVWADKLRDRAQEGGRRAYGPCLPPGAPACAVNMSEYVTGLAWANLRKADAIARASVTGSPEPPPRRASRSTRRPRPQG